MIIAPVRVEIAGPVAAAGVERGDRGDHVVIAAGSPSGGGSPISVPKS
jgi:hypothetical protein